MMRPRVLLVSAALAFSGIVAHGGPASAATTYTYSGAAGGSSVLVAGGVVRSDLTAASSLSGSTYPAASSNRLVGADVPSTLTSSTVSTSVRANRAAGTSTLTTTASTQDVSVLDGLVSAGAVRTTTTATASDSARSGSSSTRFVDLKIGGQHLPLDVAPNTGLEVPGVISVVLNESTVDRSSGNVKVQGSAVKIRLLKAIDGNAAGTVITLNPTSAALTRTTPTGVTPVTGYATGLSVKAGAGTAAVDTGRTSYVATPPTGTNNEVNTVALAGSDVPGLVSLGAVESTSRATSVPKTADVEHVSRLARVSLANGLVTADSIVVTARVRKLADGTIVKEPSTKIVGLKIAGVAVDVPTAPNSGLVVPGVGSLLINEQVETATGVTVSGLRLKAGLDIPGLPTSTDVQVGVASSGVG